MHLFIFQAEAHPSVAYFARPEASLQNSHAEEVAYDSGCVGGANSRSDWCIDHDHDLHPLMDPRIASTIIQWRHCWMTVTRCLETAARQNQGDHPRLALVKEEGKQFLIQTDQVRLPRSSLLSIFLIILW
jgi:hypothetical protein